MKAHTKACCGLISLLSTFVLCGCGSESKTAATSPAEQQQATQRSISHVQDDPKKPPEVKEKVMRQIQNEAVRHQTTR